MQTILKKSLAAALSLLMVLAFVPGAAAEQGEKPEDATEVVFAPQSDTPDKEGENAFSRAIAIGEETPDAQKEPLEPTPDADVFETAEAQKGTNVFWISTGGDVVYLPFTPSENGNYVIYSTSDFDTKGFLRNSNKEEIRSDDDNGPGRNFCLYTYTLYGGQTYYIGAGFYDSTRTGAITVRIEEMTYNSAAFDDVFDSAFNESGCLADYMMFNKLIPAHTGWYLIYTTGDADTCGIVINSYRTEQGKLEHEILSADDDGGVGRNCRMITYLNEGQEYQVGFRTHSYGAKAKYNVVVEPVEFGPKLSPGSNTVSVSERTVNYGSFTAPVTGTYRIYTVSDGDTVGYLKTEDYAEILRNDDGPGELDYYFEYDMTAGTTYQIGTRFYEAGAEEAVELVIERYDFDGTLEWNANDVQYKGTTPYVIANGSPQTPRFTVKDWNGTVVAPSNYTYEYRENVNAGTGYVIVTMKGAYAGTIRGWFKIYLPATKTTTVANTLHGVRVSWEPVPGAAGYVIYRRAWSGTTNGWTSFERWNNTTQLTWTDTKVYAGSRYQYGVKAYFTRRADRLTGAMIGGNVGDNYNLGEVGPLRTTVRITSRVLKSLKAGSKKITVNWSPSNKFTGYQIVFATDANFTKNVKSVWIAEPLKSSIDLTSLRNGTKYYVRLRSYHKFEGVQYYGEWSHTIAAVPGSGKTTVYQPNRALVIGETFYQGSSTQLPGSENDMNAVANILAGLNNDFACTKLPSVTKAQILEAIASAYAGTTDDSVSVFYFAGHGSGASDEINRGALCTVEGGRITFAELAERLSHVKGRVIVFLSSCLSGGAIAAADSADASFDPEAYDRAILDAFSGYYLDGEPGSGGTRAGEMRQSKFIVFTATGKDELGVDATFGEDDFNNGYRGQMFGAAFIKSMGCVYPDGAFKGAVPADANSDNQVTVRELYEYLYGQVLDWSTSNPIHVQYYGPDSEVLFRR